MKLTNFKRYTNGLLNGAPVFVALAAMLYAAPNSAASQISDKCDSVVAALAARGGKASAHVITRFDGAVDAARRKQLDVLGVSNYRDLSIIQSAAFMLPAGNLERLAALSFVKHISSDAPVRKNDEFTVASSGADTAFAQNNLTGAGIGIAVVDSGVRLKNDLRDANFDSRIIANASFIAGEGTDDKCGHGTHVAGIIAGSGKSSSTKDCFRTFYGIARNANIINIRVLDQYGQGVVSNVVLGIQWVIQNRTRYNVRVMNLSLGHPVGESYVTDPLCLAVESAVKAGIVVVCAAGNDGRLNASATNGMSDNEGFGTAYGTIESPGNDPLVVTVGATKSIDGKRAHDKLATYSSRGPSRLDLVLKPDIVAPGNRIISLCADNSYLDNFAGNTNDIRISEYKRTNSTDYSSTYFRLSGTSMATPVVAGAAALILQANPGLTPASVKARLMISADKWSQGEHAGDPTWYGAGYVNIPAALQCTAVATQPALSPALTQDKNGNVYVDMSRIFWGSANGTRVIWGVSGITDLRVIWGTKSIHGNTANLLSASRVIWGTSVWSDRLIWGTSNSSVDLTNTAIDGEE